MAWGESLRLGYQHVVRCANEIAALHEIYCCLKVRRGIAGDRHKRLGVTPGLSYSVSVCACVCVFCQNTRCPLPFTKLPNLCVLLNNYQAHRVFAKMASSQVAVPGGPWLPLHVVSF